MINFSSIEPDAYYAFASSDINVNNILGSGKTREELRARYPNAKRIIKGSTVKTYGINDDGKWSTGKKVAAGLGLAGLAALAGGAAYAHNKLQDPNSSVNLPGGYSLDRDVDGQVRAYGKSPGMLLNGLGKVAGLFDKKDETRDRAHAISDSFDWNKSPKSQLHSVTERGIGYKINDIGKHNDDSFTLMDQHYGDMLKGITNYETDKKYFKGKYAKHLDDLKLNPYDVNSLTNSDDLHDAATYDDKLLHKGDGTNGLYRSGPKVNGLYGQEIVEGRDGLDRYKYLTKEYKDFNPGKDSNDLIKVE